MKKIIIVGIVLLPCLVHGATNCKVVEFPDHYDASCIGDEKSGQQAVSPSSVVTSPVTAPVPDQQAVSTPSAVTSDSAALPTKQAPVSAQTNVPQTPVVHRQGRPPQSVRDEAKAMRDRVIQDQLQQTMQ